MMLVSEKSSETAATTTARRRRLWREGVAIVSALFIMAAVLMAGVATMVLTQTNLGITRNLQATTTAESNAISGMSAAFAYLQDYYAANGSLPASFTNAQLPAIQGKSYTPAYSLQAYDRPNANSARIAVAGTAGLDAEYVSEALISFSSTSGLPAYFAYGIASEGVITASGNAAYVSAGIHGNKGFSLSGNQGFYVCTARKTNGECRTFEEIDPAMVPVTASPGATTCKVSGTGKFPICDNGVPVNLTDPVTITPDYMTRQAAALADVSRGALHSAVFDIDCDIIYSSTPNQNTFKSAVASAMAGATICVEGTGDLHLSGNYDVSDVNIVMQGSIQFSGNYTTSSLTIISTGGSIKGSGNNDFESIRFFAAKDIDFSGNHDMFGMSTLAAGGDIDISGNASPFDLDGTPTVGTVIVAEGNIDITGNSKLFIAAVAGGTFRKSGNAELYGRIASKGNLTISGNFDIDSGFQIVNEDIVEASDPVLRVVSMR